MSLEKLQNVAKKLERIPIYNISLEEINPEFNIKILKQKERTGFIGNSNNDGRNIEGFLTPLDPIMTGIITQYDKYDHPILEFHKVASRDNWLHLYLMSSDIFGDIRFDAMDYRANAIIHPRIKEKSEKLHVMDLPFRGRYISGMPVKIDDKFKEQYQNLRIDNNRSFDLNSLEVSLGEPRFKSEMELMQKMQTYMGK